MAPLAEDRIYPSSALVKKQPEVKEAARKGMVRITEHGYPAFYLASDEVLKRYVDEAVAEALQAVKIRQAILQGRADYEAGDYVVGTRAARAETQRTRTSTKKARLA